MNIPACSFSTPLTNSLRLLVVAFALQTIGAFAARVAIPLERLELPTPTAGDVTIRETLPEEISGVTSEWIIIVGPACYVEPGTNSQEVVWLTLGGKATFHTGGRKYAVDEKSIARAPVGWPWTIEVPAGSTLLCVQVRKDVSAEDRGEYFKFPESNHVPYVRTFRECTPAVALQKGAKSLDRTLLPNDIVPRMSAGLVEIPGPDRVALPRHPMLDRLFVGLGDNNGRVSAGDAQTDFPPLSILHIPRGSLHSAEVAADHKLSYVRLDFFTSQEGGPSLPSASAAPVPATP